MATKPKTRKRRGSRALYTAAGALFYEWNTAHNSAILALEAQKMKDQVLLNASLESLLVHARAIREFFRTGGRETDILSRDFIGSTVRVRMPYLRKHKTRLDRRIVHLTYSRSRMTDKWDIGKIMAEIDASMRRFVDRLKIVHPLIARRVFKIL